MKKHNSKNKFAKLVLTTGFNMVYCFAIYNLTKPWYYKLMF